METKRRPRRHKEGGNGGQDETNSAIFAYEWDGNIDYGDEEPPARRRECNSKLKADTMTYRDVNSHVILDIHYFETNFRSTNASRTFSISTQVHENAPIHDDLLNLTIFAASDSRKFDALRDLNLTFCAASTFHHHSFSFTDASNTFRDEEDPPSSSKKWRLWNLTRRRYVKYTENAGECLSRTFFILSLALASKMDPQKSHLR